MSVKIVARSLTHRYEGVFCGVIGPVQNLSQTQTLALPAYNATRASHHTGNKNSRFFFNIQKSSIISLFFFDSVNEYLLRGGAKQIS